MFTLFFFGRVMESFFTSRMGTFGFALFYIGGLVISILPTYLKNRDNPNYRSLGASGAVSAVLFAFILLAPWSRIIVLVIPDAGDRLCGAVHRLLDLHGPTRAGQRQPQCALVGRGVRRDLHPAGWNRGCCRISSMR